MLAGLVRFMGQNKLPQHNPLKAEPFFEQARQAYPGHYYVGIHAPRGYTQPP